MGAERRARTVMERCDMLGSFSEETDRLTRRWGTPAMREANDAVAAWMRRAGMTVQIDTIGNVRGRYESSTPDAPTLLLGSHLDTVRDAGKYDGPLGVLVALACVEQIHERHERLPFAIEIVAFANEEGLRYHGAYMGSAAVAGAFDPACLDLLDADGIAMRDAIRTGGGDPEQIQNDKRSAADLLGYLEVHIEQGPVLEAHDLPVGVVTAIQGQSRFAVSFRGEAGHAGTVPMALRRDALCAAAEFIGAAEQIAHNHAGLVATVGQVAVEPGASNVIAGHAALTLDVRHADDAIRAQACREIEHRAQQIAHTRNVGMRWETVQEHGAVPCSHQLAALVAQAITANGMPVFELASGAGHDAVMIARIAPMAMLFVRCGGGVSHNPAESVRPDDVAAAIGVVDRFVALLAEKQTADERR